MNVHVAHVGQASLDEGTEALDGGTATSQHHVLTELVVVFRVGACDEFLDVLNNGVDDGFARSLHAVRDVEGHGLSFNGEVHENGFIWSGG